MENCKKFNDTSVPIKANSTGSLNMADVTKFDEVIITFEILLSLSLE